MPLFDKLSSEELAKIEPRVRLLDQPDSSLDGVALQIAKTATSADFKDEWKSRKTPGGAQSYWDHVRAEVFKLLCTEDPKYRKLKADVERKGAQATTLVVSLLSAALAKELGTTAGVVVPFCALCLYGSMKVGKAAYCARERELVDQDTSKKP